MIVQRGDNVRNMDLSKYEKVRKIDGDGKTTVVTEKEKR